MCVCVCARAGGAGRNRINGAWGLRLVVLAVGSGLPLRLFPHRAKSQGGMEAGPDRWSCLACIYSGVGSYASLRDSLIEVVGDTWDLVQADFLVRGVPVRGCVCVCINPALPMTLLF